MSMRMPLALLPAAAFGLLIGSFLNVVAHRLPARMSLSLPASHCPSCETPIKPYDNIPVLSWLILRGRCRSCAEPIAARYPLVEAGTALLFAAVVAVHHADTAALALGLVLVAFLVPIALIDLDHRIIPNRLTLPAAVIAIVLGTALDPGGQVERLIAGAAGAAVLGLPALLNPKGMGLGDAKLVGVLGLYLGAAVAPAVFVAFIVGTVLGIAIIMRKGMVQGRKTAVPFGPFLALGGIVGVLAGNELVSLYLGTF
ncbi:MAG: leader peptidase (prepilin peptidase) / N-methyltransferase [Solirubrobacteraceae bacterium]|nr:leader peptidase (prepilin peptidase) / N-methyltransferase [Solirubrobacteraceae bacterium]